MECKGTQKIAISKFLLKKAADFSAASGSALTGSGLLLPALVSLIELVYAACGIDELDLAGVKRMGSVGDFHLYYGILDSVHHQSLFGLGAGARDKHSVVRHILESYKTVGFGMNSFFHCLFVLNGRQI